MLNIYRKLKDHKAVIGDAISRRTTSISVSSAAALDARLSANGIRKGIKRVESQEILDASNVLKDIKIIKKASRIIMREDPKKMLELYEKYRENPTTLNKVINKHIALFSSALREFIAAYRSFLESISDMLKKGFLKESLDAQEILGLLTRWEELVKKNQLYYNQRLLLDIKKEIKKFLYYENRRLQNQGREEIKEEKEGHLRASFFSPSGSHAAHKLKKLWRRRSNEEITDLKENWAILKKEVDSGHIEPDFLARLLKHLKNLERIEKYQKAIMHDIDLLISSVDEEVEESWKTIGLFLAQYKNNPEVINSEIPGELGTLKKLREDVNQILSESITNIKKIINELHKEGILLNNIFSEISKISNTIVDRINNNPESVLDTKIAA